MFLISIPEIDRKPLGECTQNLIGKVLDYKNNIHQIGTQYKRLYEIIVKLQEYFMDSYCRI